MLLLFFGRAVVVSRRQQDAGGEACFDSFLSSVRGDRASYLESSEAPPETQGLRMVLTHDNFSCMVLHAFVKRGWVHSLPQRHNATVLFFGRGSGATVEAAHKYG